MSAGWEYDLPGIHPDPQFEDTPFYKRYKVVHVCFIPKFRAADVVAGIQQGRDRLLLKERGKDDPYKFDALIEDPYHDDGMSDRMLVIFLGKRKGPVDRIKLACILSLFDKVRWTSQPGYNDSWWSSDEGLDQARWYGISIKKARAGMSKVKDSAGKDQHHRAVKAMKGKPERAPTGLQAEDETKGDDADMDVQAALMSQSALQKRVNDLEAMIDQIRAGAQADEATALAMDPALQSLPRFPRVLDTAEVEANIAVQRDILEHHKRACKAADDASTVNLAASETGTIFTDASGYTEARSVRGLKERFPVKEKSPLPDKTQAVLIRAYGDKLKKLNKAGRDYWHDLLTCSPRKLVKTERNLHLRLQLLHCAKQQRMEDRDADDSDKERVHYHNYRSHPDGKQYRHRARKERAKTSSHQSNDGSSDEVEHRARKEQAKSSSKKAKEQSPDLVKQRGRYDAGATGQQNEHKSARKVRSKRSYGKAQDELSEEGCTGGRDDDYVGDDVQSKHEFEFVDGDGYGSDARESASLPTEDDSSG